MQQLAVRPVRQLGGQCIDAVEVRHQVRLWLRVYPSDRGLQLLERFK